MHNRLQARMIVSMRTQRKKLSPRFFLDCKYIHLLHTLLKVKCAVRSCIKSDHAERLAPLHQIWQALRGLNTDSQMAREISGCDGRVMVKDPSLKCFSGTAITANILQNTILHLAQYIAHSFLSFHLGWIPMKILHLPVPRTKIDGWIWLNSWVRYAVINCGEKMTVFQPGNNT